MLAGALLGDANLEGANLKVGGMAGAYACMDSVTPHRQLDAVDGGGWGFTSSAAVVATDAQQFYSSRHPAVQGHFCPVY